jgi:hypothetical protein
MIAFGWSIIMFAVAIAGWVSVHRNLLNQPWFAHSPAYRIGAVTLVSAASVGGAGIIHDGLGWWEVIVSTAFGIGGLIVLLMPPFRYSMGEVVEPKGTNEAKQEPSEADTGEYPAVKDDGMCNPVEAGELFGKSDSDQQRLAVLRG